MSAPAPGGQLGRLFLISFRHPLLRAGVHPLVRQHGGLPDVLHQHRAAGLLPGDVGRLPGGVEPARLDAPGRLPLLLLAVLLACGTLVGATTSSAACWSTSAGRSRRSRSTSAPSIARGDVGTVRRADRGGGGDVLRADRADVRRPRAGDGPGVQRGPRPRRRLHDNIVGSLAGIAAFAVAVVSADAAACLVRHASACSAVLRAAPDAVVSPRAARRARWSWCVRRPALGGRMPGRSGRPTTRFSYTRHDGPHRHQQHRPPADGADRLAQPRAILLPHLLNRDAGRRPFADVLIIGAGSGNDVAAALAQRGDARRRRRDRPGDLRDRPRATTPTARTTTRASRSTSTTAAASCARPTASTTWSSTRSSTRWCCTRAIRACAWRASCSPSEAFRRHQAAA